MDQETWQWWITVIEIPVMIGLFLMVMKTREEASKASRDSNDDLHNFKVKAAETYAGLVYLTAVETRLLSNMGAVEQRLNIRLDNLERKIDHIGRESPPPR